MKKYPLLLLLLLLGIVAPSQVTVQLLVDGKPGALISDYFGNAADRLQLNVVTPAARDVYFRASITGQGNGVLIENPGFKPAQAIHLVAGLNNFSGANSSVLYNSMSGSDVNVTGIDKNQAMQSLTLPEGFYQMCVYCYDYATDQQIGQGCANLNIQLLEQPRIVTPLNGQDISIVSVQTPLNIPVTWTPVPNAPGVRYDLKLIEVPKNVNPEEAVLQAGQGALPIKFQRKDLLTPMFQIDATTGVTLDTGKTYALQVYAHGTNLNIKNNGLSDPAWFHFKLKNSPIVAKNDTAASAPISGISMNCACKAALPSGAKAVENINLLPNQEFTMAGMPVKISTVTVVSDKKTFSGTGTIPFPIVPGGKAIPLKVRFQEVQVAQANGKYIAISGKAAEDANLGALGFLPEYVPGQKLRLPKTEQDRKAFLNWLNAAGKDKVFAQNEALSLLPGYQYELPLGIKKSVAGTNQTIAITGLSMDHQQAAFDAAYVMDLVEANKTILFRAHDVCFNASDMCGQGILYLAEDISMNLGGNISSKKGILRMKAPKESKGPNNSVVIDTSKGTYVQWSKSGGFTSLQVGGQYLFDKSLIVTADAKPDTVRSEIAFKAVNGWEDWMASIEMPKFRMASDTTFTFGPAMAYYDHSSLKNPEGLPQKVSAQEGNSWKGAYLKDLKTDFPAFVKSAKDPGRVQAGIRDLAVDHFGVSVVADASNILTLDDGTLDGWYFSIDNFKLSVYHNSFDSGGMSGKLMLPLTKYMKGTADKRNWLDYKCTLTNKPGNCKQAGTDKCVGFQFVVTPNDTLDFAVWLAKARIEKSSKIEVLYNGSSGLVAQARLNGNFTIEGKVKGLPKAKLDLIDFQDLTLRTRSPYFSPGKTSFFGLASPEKQIGPFTFTLDSIGKSGSFAPPALDATDFSKPQLSASEDLGIYFAGSMKLCDIDAMPKASTALSITNKLSFQNGRFKIEEKPTLHLNKIQLSASDVAGISLTGGLEIFDAEQNPVYGDGFKGNLAVKFPPGFEIGSTVQFGGVSGMKYWYVDASLKFPSGTGIPLFPGTKLNGFAGGAYYHMKAAVDLTKQANFLTPAPAKADTKPDTSGTSAIGSTPSGASYKPDANTALGIKARLYFGLQAERILTCNAGLEIAFDKSYGISLFQVDGEGHYIPDSKDNGVLNANVLAKIQWLRTGSKVTNTIFDAAANVKAGNALFAINVPLKMHFERPGNPLWHVKLGAARTPADALLPKGTPRPDAAYIELLSGIAKAEGYFAVGNYDMPTTMPEIPQYIKDILAKSKGSGDNRADDAEATAQKEQMKADYAMKVESASGSKPSILFGASEEFHLDETIAIIYIKADAGYGFDAMLRNYSDVCPGIGLNGWYASAQAYAGVAAALGVRVKLLGVKLQKEFLSAGLAAVLQGGLPNTTYLNGEAGGYYSVLDGLVSGSFNVGFKLGSRPGCSPGATSALADVQLIQSITPEDGAKNMELAIKPEIRFTFKDGVPFTLSDINSDGTMSKKRQFVFAHQVNPSDFDFKYGQQGGADKNEGFRIGYFEKRPGETEKALAFPDVTVFNKAQYSNPKSNTVNLLLKKLPLPLTEARIAVSARLYENQNYNNGQPGSPVKWALAREGGQIFEQSQEAKYTYTSGVSEAGKVATGKGLVNLVGSSFPSDGERFAFMAEDDGYNGTITPSIGLTVNDIDPCYWNIPAASCKSATLVARLVNLTQPATTPQVFTTTKETGYWGGVSYKTKSLNGIAKPGNIYALQYCWTWPDANAKAPAKTGSAVENALALPSNFIALYTATFGVSKYGNQDAKINALKLAGGDFGKGGHLTAAQMNNPAALKAAVKAMTDAELLTAKQIDSAKKLAQKGGSILYDNGISPAAQAAMDSANYWRILPHHTDYGSDEPFSENTYLYSTNASKAQEAQKLQSLLLSKMPGAIDTAKMKLRPLSHYAMQEETMNEVPALNNEERKSGKLQAFPLPKDACSQALKTPVYFQCSYSRLEAGNPTDPPMPPGAGAATNTLNIVLGAIKAKKDLVRPGDFTAIGQLYDALTNNANQVGMNTANGLFGAGLANQLSGAATKGQIQNVGNALPAGGGMKGKTIGK